MKFGEILCNLSKNCDFEKSVFSLMKQPLMEIAGDRHASGCHVKFVDFSDTFLTSMKKVVESENLKFLFEVESGELIFNTIVWDLDKGSTLEGYRDLSDKMLIITKNSNGRIDVEKKELEKKVNKNTYVN